MSRPFVVIDRNTRVIALIVSADPDAAAEAALVALSTCPVEPPRDETTPAPVLVIPNVFDASFCRRLIDHFDRGEHMEGMASLDPQGRAFHKIDETKKRRLDCVVRPNDAIHQPVIEALTRACLPEITRAFQTHPACFDRILIARYDDTGGYFLRHRDNSAPAVAYRQFAMSINLNTGEYEGGHLLFPEYNDYRYKPGLGAAIVFSATRLHEATPVLNGPRYLLLTFVHNAEAEMRRRDGRA